MHNRLTQMSKTEEEVCKRIFFMLVTILRGEQYVIIIKLGSAVVFDCAKDILYHINGYVDRLRNGIMVSTFTRQGFF